MRICSPNSSPPSLPSLGLSRGAALTTCDARLNSASYQIATLRPVVSLLFVVPILLAYELGVQLLDGEVSRNGVELWLRGLFSTIGLNHYFFLPAAVVLAMVAWHHRRQDHWGFPATILVWMIIESVVLALILFLAAKAHHLFFDNSTAGLAISQPHLFFRQPDWSTVVGFLGAGVYEEFVFRLMLFPLAILAIEKLTRSSRLSTGLAMIFISLVFSAIHYQVLNPVGDPFELTGFIFRFAASIVFSLLFLHRGFGIAVGTHTAYNLLTQF